MKKPDDQPDELAGIREQIIGLGKRSARKSYYPELLEKLADLERFKTLLDQSNDAIFLTDSSTGRMIYASKSACTQIGYSEEECRSLTLYDIASESAGALDDIYSGQRDSIVFDASLRKKNGEKTPYELNMRRVTFKNAEYVVAIARDIAERVQAEAELKEAKSRAELYLDLMSHDITNMNQALMGYLEVIGGMQESGAVDRSLISDSIEVINRSTRIIEDVKKLTLLRSGKVPLKTVDLSGLLTAMIDRYSTAQGRPVTINFSPGEHCTVKASDQAADIFEKLIDNAIRHSNGPVIVDIAQDRVTLDNHRYCRVTIADHGPGIPHGQKIKMFMTPEELREKTARRGFSMYLVRTLVDYYRGRVWVEDRVPGDYSQGAKFVVLLPQDDS